MAGALTVHRAGATVWCTLDRPPLNLLEPALIRTLRETFEALAADRATRIAIVTGPRRRAAPHGRAGHGGAGARLGARERGRARRARGRRRGGARGQGPRVRAGGGPPAERADCTLARDGRGERGAPGHRRVRRRVR